MKYLLPLLAVVAIGCKKRSCYTCPTIVVSIPIGRPGTIDTTTLSTEAICDYTEEEIRLFEYKRSRIDTYVQNGVGTETRVLMICVPQQ